MKFSDEETKLIKFALQFPNKLISLSFDEKVILAKLATACVLDVGHKEKMRPFFTNVQINIGWVQEPEVWNLASTIRRKQVE